MVDIPEVSGTLMDPADFVTLLGTENPVILDIGANDGYSTEGFLSAFPNATLHCFEPDPRALAKFRARLGDRANLYPLAISDRDGTATFHQSGGQLPDREYQPEGWDQSGSLRRPKSHLDIWPTVTFDTTLDVVTRSLDSWAQENSLGPVDLIWMDVQGAEDLVFDGAVTTLTRTHYVFTEYADNEQYEGQPTLSELLARLPGWVIDRRLSNDVLLRNTAWSVEWDSSI